MDNSIKDILAIIRKYQVNIPAKEQLTLLKKYRNENNKEARELLIRANYAFCYSVSRRYVNPHISAYDMFTATVAGMCKAIEKYNLNKNVNFISYAVFHLKAAVYKKLNEEGHGIIKMPELLIIENRKLIKEGKEPINLDYSTTSTTVNSTGDIVDIFETIEQSTISSPELKIDSDVLYRTIDQVIESMPEDRRDAARLKILAMDNISYEEIVNLLKKGSILTHTTSYKQLMRRLKTNSTIAQLV